MSIEVLASTPSIIVGPTNTADGVGAGPSRRSRTNASVMAAAHAEMCEAAIRGRIFTGSNLLGTPVTTQAGLSATTPALTLSNPTGSGVYANLLRVTVGVNAAPAAATTMCIAVNANAAAPTATTEAAMINGSYGLGVGNAVKCFRVATLAAAPVAVFFLGSISAASLVDTAVMVHNLFGMDGLAPGSQLSFQASTAVAVFVSFTWEEVPI